MSLLLLMILVAMMKTHSMNKDKQCKHRALFKEYIIDTTTNFTICAILTTRQFVLFMCTCSEILVKLLICVRCIWR